MFSSLIPRGLFISLSHPSVIIFYHLIILLSYHPTKSLLRTYSCWPLGPAWLRPSRPSGAQAVWPTQGSGHWIVPLACCLFLSTNQKKIIDKSKKNRWQIQKKWRQIQKKLLTEPKKTSTNPKKIVDKSKKNREQIQKFLSTNLKNVVDKSKKNRWQIPKKWRHTGCFFSLGLPLKVLSVSR